MGLGFAPALDDQLQLRVRPARNIDESVHGFLIANKRLLVMELADLSVTRAWNGEEGTNKVIACRAGIEPRAGPAN